MKKQLACYFFALISALVSGPSLARTISLSAGDEVTVGGTRVTCEIDESNSTNYCECRETQAPSNNDCWKHYFQDIYVIKFVGGRELPATRLTTRGFKGGSVCNNQPDSWFENQQQQAKERCEAAILTRSECR